MSEDVKNYAVMYIDAFVVASQCSLLEHAPTPLEPKDGRASGSAGVFTDDVFDKLQKETDKAIFICYQNYSQNGASFVLQQESAGIPGLKKPNYRSLQKDSARCYLLFLLVAVRAYVGKASDELKKGTFQAEEVGNHLLDKLQKIKFGVGMLQANDIHADQVVIVLRGVINAAKPVLEKAGILPDFQYITEFIAVKENRGKLLDQDQLGALGKAMPDFNAPDQAEAALPTEYAKIYKILRARDPQRWTQYKTFVRICKQADPAVTPGAVPSNRRDTEMRTDSPGKKSGADQPVDEEDELLTFNLQERYEKAFARFKKAFGTIIGDLHVPLAANTDARKCKSDDAFVQFCLDKYGVPKMQ